MFRRAIYTLIALFAFSSAQSAYSANEPIDTVVVQGSREQVKRQVETFVGNVTRMDGELVGRWRNSVCPLIAGVSDDQAAFMRARIVEVFDTARKKKRKEGVACHPNLFVIISDDPDQLIAEWKERDPGMFRWKTRDGVTRSKGPGAVRTWHNATEEPSEGDPLIESSSAPPQGKMTGSRIVSSAAEAITAVVVLIDARATGKVTLAQLSDYVTMVSLAQLDLGANLGPIDSILRLFGEPRAEVPPVAMTAWDYAFLNALYRVSYEPTRQRGDIRARMVRELAP